MAGFAPDFRGGHGRHSGGLVRDRSHPDRESLRRATHGVDLRDVGGGTVSGTSLYRVAGFVPLALAGILDIAKALPARCSRGPTGRFWRRFAGGLAVAGHNWSPFLRGAGRESPAIGAVRERVGRCGPAGRWPHRRPPAPPDRPGLLRFARLRWYRAFDHQRMGRRGRRRRDRDPAPAEAGPREHPATEDRVRVYLHRLLFDHDPAPELCRDMSLATLVRRTGSVTPHRAGRSALGDWMGTFALMALALELTNSPVAVGGSSPSGCSRRRSAVRWPPASRDGGIVVARCCRWTCRVPRWCSRSRSSARCGGSTSGVSSSRSRASSSSPHATSIPDLVGDVDDLPWPTASSSDVVRQHPRRRGVVAAVAALPVQFANRPYALVFLMDAATFVVSFLCRGSPSSAPA